jgi:hypothetical protein
MLNLTEMVGQVIVAHIPRLHPTLFQEVRLHGVEVGGIWIESQMMTNTFFATAGYSASPKTLVFFFPYNQIGFVMSSIEGPSLSEKSFGV